MTPLMLNAHHRLQLAGFTYEQATVYLEIVSEIFEAQRAATIERTDAALKQSALQSAGKASLWSRLVAAYRSKYFLWVMVTAYFALYGYCLYLVSLIPQR